MTLKKLIFLLQLVGADIITQSGFLSPRFFRKDSPHTQPSRGFFTHLGLKSRRNNRVEVFCEFLNDLITTHDQDLDQHFTNIFAIWKDRFTIYLAT